MGEQNNDDDINPRLVLSTLRPLVKTAPERTCYRLIGGVLVERTVQDVVPALETNFGGIKEVLESLMKSYKGREEEFGNFQREYGIQVSLKSEFTDVNVGGRGTDGRWEDNNDKFGTLAKARVNRRGGCRHFDVSELSFAYQRSRLILRMTKLYIMHRYPFILIMAITSQADNTAMQGFNPPAMPW